MDEESLDDARMHQRRAREELTRGIHACHPRAAQAHLALASWHWAAAWQKGLMLALKEEWARERGKDCRVESSAKPIAEPDRCALITIWQ